MIIKIDAINSQIFSRCGRLTMNERFNIIDLNLTKQISLKTIDLSPAYQPCITFSHQQLQRELTISWTQITSYHLNKKYVKKDPMAAKPSC